MREIYVLIFTLSVLSILPSLIFTTLSGLAFRQNWAFWYYDFSLAAFVSPLFLMMFVLWFYIAPISYGKEEGYVLLTLPLLGLIVGCGAFLLGLLTYPFWDFKKAFWTAKTLPSYPFWGSLAAMVGFELIWLLLIFGKSPPFRR